MIIFNNTQFSEHAEKLTFEEFKEVFKNIFNKEDIRKAFKAVKGRDGNTTRTTKKGAKPDAKEDK